MTIATTNVTRRWANWAVVKVDYDAEGKSIETLWCRQVTDSGGMSAELTPLTRASVVNAIEHGSVFKTVFKHPVTNQNTIGAQLQVIVVGGKKYVTTDANKTPRDNLSEL